MKLKGGSDDQANVAFDASDFVSPASATVRHFEGRTVMAIDDWKGTGDWNLNPTVGRRMSDRVSEPSRGSPILGQAGRPTPTDAPDCVSAMTPA
jgi:hypothetical protein